MEYLVQFLKKKIKLLVYKSIKGLLHFLRRLRNYQRLNILHITITNLLTIWPHRTREAMNVTTILLANVFLFAFEYQILITIDSKIFLIAITIQEYPFIAKTLMNLYLY